MSDKQIKTKTTSTNRRGTEKEKVMPLSNTKTSPIGVRFVVVEPIVNGKAIAKNPFIIGKTITKNVGKALEIRSMKGGTSYLIKCDSSEQADKLLKVSQLTDKTTVKVELHKTLNSCRCVVFCREVMDVPEDELKEELEPQGVLDVKRIVKKVDGKATPLPMLIVTMNGTTVPEYLSFGGLRVRTRLYYPSPLICYNCCRFGHIGKECKSGKRCNNCSQEHDEVPVCKNEKKCINCKEGHSAFDKRCPIYKKEIEIIKIKCDKNISFNEAKREHSSRHPNKRTYAEVAQRIEQAQSPPGPDMTEFNDLKALLEASKKEIEALKAQNDKLKEDVKELTDLLADEIVGAIYSQKPKDLPDGSYKFAEPTPTNKADEVAQGFWIRMMRIKNQAAATPTPEAALAPKRFIEPEKPVGTKKKRRNKKKSRGNTSTSESE